MHEEYVKALYNSYATVVSPYSNYMIKVISAQLKLRFIFSLKKGWIRKISKGKLLELLFKFPVYPCLQNTAGVF